MARASTNNKSVIYKLQSKLWHPSCISKILGMLAAPVFLDKLQFGFLQFETQQGWVRVELCLWQRLYLLWTFRNFRRLSTPLLNPRQRRLVNALFRTSAAVPHSRDPLLAIGVVENFVLATAPTGAPPVPQRERSAGAVASPAEIAHQPIPTRFALPRVSWSKLAATLGALFLCVISVVAWHRIQGIPGSQAHNQPRLLPMDGTVTPNAAPFEKPADTAGSFAANPMAATAQPRAVPKGVVQSALIAAVSSVRQQATHVQAAASTRNLQLSNQDSSIPASRPPLRFVYPDYSDVSARGVVALTARVDSDGTVRTVKVVSGNRGLAAAAVRAVRQWRYRPYLKDGQPVATETNIVISFISDDAISMTFPPSIPASH